MLIILDVKNEIHKKSWLSYGNKIKNHQGLSQILHTIRLLSLKMLPKLRVCITYLHTRQLEILLKLTDKLMPFDTISQTFLDLF